MTSIRACSYNCFSLSKNIELVRELTESNYDIIFLQETLVTDNNLGMLDFIDESYKSIGIGATHSNKSMESGYGRPMGGLGCIFKNNIPIKLIDSSNDIMIVSITLNSVTLILVNVYLRSILDAYTLAEYTSNLHQLDQILNGIE